MIGEELPSPGEFGREAFGTASGLAVVVGALSVVVPGFGVLTATLVALALVGWASVHRRGARSLRRSGPASAAYVVAFVVLGATTAAYLDPPPALLPWRALLLGLGIVPLWSIERRGPPRAHVLGTRR